MRLSGTKTGAANQYRGLGDQLWDLGGARPTLDLNFAQSKSLVDATTGSNLVDFTRASSGTYVGSDGLIKTATTNLLTYSEEFDNAIWQVTSPGEVTIISGVEDPLGGNTADTLYRDSGAGDTGWLRRLFSGVSGQTYTLSFWLRRRSGTGDFIAVVGDNINQVISGITSTWQRFSVSNTISSTTLRAYFNVNSFGDQFDIWGAQLEQSTTVGEYVKTTSTINSAPRFDHDPTTGESLGLLVEESRTNLLLRSEEFDNVSIWTNAGTVTWSASADAAPDGSFTVDKPNGIFTHWGIYDVTNVSWLSGYPAAFPFAVTSAWTRQSLTFTVPAGCTSLRFYPGRVTAFGSYFYQTVTATPGTTYTASAYYKLDSASSTVLVWGAQLEAGAFPTSYIPTTSSTVTRAADVASISGSNFSSWYRQDEGTVFAECQQPDVSKPNTVVTSFSDGTGSNRIEIRSSSGSNGQARFEIVTSGTVEFSNSPNAGSPFRKLAFGYLENNTANAADGTIGLTDGTVTIPSISQVFFGNDLFLTDTRPGLIKRLTYWPTRLPNETLQTITQ